MKYTIKTILKTQSPLHIAAPGDLRMDPNDGRLIYSGGIPCTGIQRLEYIHEGERKRVPVIAANNIAGHMRRLGAKHILNALRKKDQKVSLKAYSVLQCGAFTGSPDTRDFSYAEYKAASEHPYFGLFGGGPRMIRRNMRVHNALPVLPSSTALIGAMAHPRAEHYTQPEESYEKGCRLTMPWAFRHIDDLLSLVNVSQMEETIDNFEAEIQERTTLILKEKASKKAGEEGVFKSTPKTYAALEFVVPGVNFGLNFELDVSNAQMGLFFESLDSFTREVRLGGHSRNGFGQFSLNDMVLIDENGEQFDGLFNNGSLIRDHDLISEFLKAWASVAETLEAADIDKIIAEPEKKKSKTSKKKPAATAEA